MAKLEKNKVQTSNGFPKFFFITVLERLSKPAAAMYAIFAIVLYGIGEYKSVEPRDVFTNSYKIYAGISAILAVFLWLWRYLAGDNIEIKNRSASGAIHTETYTPRSIEGLRVEIQGLKTSFTSLLEKSSSSQEIDINALTSSIQAQVITDLPPKFISELEKKFATKLVDNYQIDLLRQSLQNTTLRLNKEVDTAGRRSNLNLLIGIFTTGLAAVLLSYVAFESKATFDNMTVLLSHYIPRVTTIIFIEVFAFFFLRLYKSGLQEIKYFQNELTNIELQRAGIEASLLQKPSESMTKVVQQLIQTERNPINQAVALKDEGGNSLDVKDTKNLVEVLSALTGKK